MDLMRHVPRCQGQNVVQWRALVNAVMNFGFTCKASNSVTGLAD